MFCNKSNEIWPFSTSWFDAFGAEVASWNDVFDSISFDFMQNMILNCSLFFYQKAMFCNKYNVILSFLPQWSSFFATLSERFFSILLGGWSFYTAGKAFRGFHVVFNVFVHFHKKTSFWCVVRFSIKTNAFLVFFLFSSVWKMCFFRSPIVT